MKVKVAIVVVGWNRKEDSLNCLRSLARIKTPAVAVIFVDNGSTDGSAEAVRREFPAVVLITSGRNLGFAGGSNLGIRKALEGGADYVCLLNNDAVVDPRFLNELLRAAVSYPRAGILGSRVYFLDRPGRIWSQGISVNRWTGRIHAQSYSHPESEVPSGIGEVKAVSGAAVLLKREMLSQIGLFDESYFLCFEDIDLCLRARAAGWAVIAVPASRVRHKVSASMGGEHSAAVVYYATRNHLRLLARRLPLPCPAEVMRTLLVAGYTLLFAVFRSRAPFRERWKAWRKGITDYARGKEGEMNSK